MHAELSGRYRFDINAILRQYLGIHNLYSESDELQGTLTQEELEEQFDNDVLQVDNSDPDVKTSQQVELKPNDKKKIQKLVDTLIEAFTNKDIVENRPLPLLLDDLKVASIILRMGLDKGWITAEEYFDATYTLWTEFFFSCEIDVNRGYLDLKLDQEDVEIEDIQSAELSATMLSWLFAIEPSNDIKYIRLLMSAILVHAKFPWIFVGSSAPEIDKELNKTLIAIQPEKLEQTLVEYFQSSSFWFTK